MKKITLYQVEGWLCDGGELNTIKYFWSVQRREVPSNQFQLRLTVSLNSSLVIWSKCTPRAAVKGRERAFLNFTNEFTNFTTFKWFQKCFGNWRRRGKVLSWLNGDFRIWFGLKILNIVSVHLNYVWHPTSEKLPSRCRWSHRTWEARTWFGRSRCGPSSGIWEKDDVFVYLWKNIWSGVWRL